MRRRPLRSGPLLRMVLLVALQTAACRAGAEAAVRFSHAHGLYDHPCPRLPFGQAIRGPAPDHNNDGAKSVGPNGSRSRHAVRDGHLSVPERSGSSDRRRTSADLGRERRKAGARVLRRARGSRRRPGPARRVGAGTESDPDGVAGPGPRRLVRKRVGHLRTPRREGPRVGAARVGGIHRPGRPRRLSEGLRRPRSRGLGSRPTAGV